jgi:DNA-directed RNA polymerase specialized sigma24 family protein
VDLCERHFHRVYAYVSRRVSSRAEAEDVTSEVFEQAAQNRNQGSGIRTQGWARE